MKVGLYSGGAVKTIAVTHYHHYDYYYLTLGMALGCFLTGWVSDKLHKSKQNGVRWAVRKALEMMCKFAWTASSEIWYKAPDHFIRSKPVCGFGHFIHRRACCKQDRTPGALYTRFFRNRPQLEVLRSIIAQRPFEATLKLTVLGCSTGAELYSAVAVIKKSRPDLILTANGIDISREAIEKAECGVYDASDRELENLKDEEVDGVFLKSNNLFKIHPSLKSNITWHVADACNPLMLDMIGLQDIVIANNFLIHWCDEKAEQCLRSIFDMVSPGGFLFVWGVDLDVKHRVVQELNLNPVPYKIDEVHEADEAGLQAWPWKYWGIEPLDEKRSDWKERYATVYQVPYQNSGYRNPRRQPTS